jgi:hypothetical protein
MRLLVPSYQQRGFPLCQPFGLPELLLNDALKLEMSYVSLGPITRELHQISVGPMLIPISKCC